jgi:hypothetical protein
MEGIMKNIIIGVLVLLLGLALFGTWVQHRAANAFSQMVDVLDSKLQESDLFLGRAKVQIGDANKYIDELEEKVQDEIRSHNGTVSLVAKLRAELKVSGNKTTVIEVPSSTIEVPAELNFAELHYYFALTNKELADLGTEFRQIYSDHRIDTECLMTSINGEPVIGSHYKLHLELVGVLTEVTLLSGKTAYYASIFEIDDKGEIAERLNLKAFRVLKEDQRIYQLRLAPHLDIGGIVGAGLRQGNLVSGLSVGVSGWGYGKTENDLIYRFPRLGLVANSNFVALELNPVLYNLGGPLPIVSNIWVGPGLIWNPSEFGLVFSVNSVL